MDNLEKMSRRKQLNPKPIGLKRSFSELLIDIAKSLNLPEDLSLKQRKPNCNSFNSIDSIKKDDNLLNGKLDDDELNEQAKPKQLNNKSQNNDNQNNLNDSIDNSIDNLDNSLNNLDNSLINLDNNLNNSINNENGKLINENNLNEELNDEIDKQLNDFNQNTLFSIFTERKLMKGQRFGPYLIKFSSTILDSNDDDKNSDNLKDKENQFYSNQIDSQSEINQTQSIQIQEPTGFWLKIIRTSSNQPTALIKIEENEIWLEILEDLNEQTELSIAKNYQFETLSKNLNKLNTSTMITDELLDSILEEEQLNGINDKENDLDDSLMNEELNNDEDGNNKNELNDKLNLINKNEQQDITDVDNESEDSINRIDSSANYFVCKNCGIRFSNINTLTVHQTNYCTKQQLIDQTESINGAFKMLLDSGLFKREKRSIDDSNEPKPKKHQTEDTMCNNTSRDQLMITGNSQLSNDVNSDSEELNKDIQDEQINNSNNSSISLSNLQQNTSIDNQNGLLESLNSARILQATMNLLSNLSESPNQDEQPSQQLNAELLETIQRLFNQNGNQSLANSLIAAANANQRTNWFACKFCSFTTSKRQQLIKHVKTNCEGLMTAVANLQSTNNSTNLINNSSSNSTNNTATNSPTTGEQDESNSATVAAANNQLSTAVMAAALSNEQLNSGCGNLICVNSNCTSNGLNGNNCVLLSNLPNTTSLSNNDKFKSIGPAEDSEDDYASSSNPQDRYCMECEIQFASYKNYKVHKDIYCGSRHCSQKIQQPPVNLINSRKRTISDTISNNLPTSLASVASTTSAVVNNITNLLSNQSSNSKTTNSLNNKTIATSTSKSPQKNLFNQSPLNTNSAVQQLSALCKNSSLLNLNANNSETGSPNLQQTTQQTANLQTSMATTTLNSNIPASLTSNVNMNAQQTAILNELFANGNIINLQQSINLIQQLSQPVYIAISTNPLILLPINSALNNNSSLTGNSTANTPSNTNKSPSSSTNNQDINEQSLNNQINGILNQALDSLNKNNSILNLINQQANQSNNLQLNASSPINNAQQRPGDEPMDLSAKRKCTAARLNSVASLLEHENLVNNPQLLKNLDALSALNVFNSTNAVDVAAFLLPKTLNTQKPNTYSCDNCQINFHKYENYIVHKKHYCSATKQFEQQVNNIGNSQKQSPTPTDDLDSVNYLNSGPNSPQSSQSINHQQIINRTTSAASLATLTAATVSLVDSMNNQTSTNNKKLSTSLSIAANKNSGCISPNNLSSNNSPVSSPPTTTFVSLQNNQLKSNSTTTAALTNPIPQPSQPIYKCFCNKCGIRFTSQDNLFAHQTYYCINNSINGSIINDLNEVTCPKCRSVYGNEELFLTHICSANVAVSSQVSSVNNSSTNNTQTNSLSNINTSASSLLEAIESIKQQQTLMNSKLTSSLLNQTAVSNSLMNVSNSPLITANNLTSTSTNKSNNNNQAFKCTLCGYKGHTLRGMKTHVRVHGDQLQGAQEESFIIPLTNDNDCCNNLPLSNGTNCTNLNCRNTRLINQNANKRRRSTDPMSNLLSNFVLPNNTNSPNSVISKELLLANSLNNLNPILSNSLMNGLMNNLVNHLNNPLVSGLIGSNLNSNNSALSANLLNLNSNNSAASSLNAEVTSETEDNLDNSIQNNNSNNNGSLTCNGTIAVGNLSSNSNSIGKC